MLFTHYLPYLAYFCRELLEIILHTLNTEPLSIEYTTGLERVTYYSHITARKVVLTHSRDTHYFVANRAVRTQDQWLGVWTERITCNESFFKKPIIL